MRALVVLGGAAAACAIAWLTATASASTADQLADGPDAPAIGNLQQPVLSPVVDTVTPVLARDLAGTATRLAGVVETDATSAVPAPIDAVGHLAVAATDHAQTTEPAAEPPPAVLDTARKIRAPRTPVSSGPGNRPAEFSPAVIPVRAVAAAEQPHADHQPEHGAGDFTGHSWLPSCTVSASAGFDHCFGEAWQPAAAEDPQPAHRRDDVLRLGVQAAEIQPGITPD
ncbi:hypothetical protein [Amycolatopsis australiensis]|uniref:Secreted protein n=1 Tax=Amycolatopsis australiensis TaxID=546364 RepID=A0A1K1QJI1_9PSEU|nr:hypothetical protein [Amycolatopsis australiensis]SFW60090.1 hypothetical protein SAMN04489730_1892 [Amycolatopsis australiensis]